MLKPAVRKQTTEVVANYNNHLHNHCPPDPFCPFEVQ